MPLFHRQYKECAKGSQFYSCDSNKFKGCCSVDPCNLSGCPASKSTSTAEPSKTVIVVVQGASSSSRATVLTITASRVTASATIQDAILSTSTEEITTATSSFSAPTPSSLISTTSSAMDVSITSPATANYSVAKPSFAKENIGVIAGSIGGVFAVLTAALLIYFCYKRKKRQRARSSSALPFRESKGPYARGRQSDDELRAHHNQDDVFAPFGGRHRTSGHDRGQSNDTTASQQTLIHNPITRPALDDHEDAPLADTEKSSFNPPPIAEHPALHPRPGESPEVPAYTSESVNATPEMHPTHLARHPSLLEQHPALRNSRTRPAEYSGTHTSSHSQLVASRPDTRILNRSDISILPSQVRTQRESTSSANNKYFPSYSPIPTSFNYAPKVAKVASRPHISQELDAKRSPPLARGVTPPIPGTTELPAAIPHELGGDNRNFHMISRGLSTNTVGTQASTYSIPIGLGVENTTRQPNVLDPVKERGSMSEASGSPGYPTQDFISPISPDMRSPSTKNSPQDFYTVSPPFPPTPSAQFPSSASTSRIPILRNPIVNAYASSPYRPSPLSPDVSVRQASIDTSPRALSKQRSESSIKRLQDAKTSAASSSSSLTARTDGSENNALRSKSTIGKGNEGVTAWATYRGPADGTPTSGPPTPVGRSGIGSELEGCSRRDVEMRMTRQFEGAFAKEQPKAQNEKDKFATQPQQDRSDWPLTTHQLPTRSVPSLIREERERDRWSGSTVITP